MLFNFWFNPSGFKVFGFKTQKFSLRFKSVLVSSADVCFLICSIKVNSACCWKLWFCSLKYLHAKIEASDLASFLWLFRRMLKGLSLFPTYWSWHIQIGIYTSLGCEIFERFLFSCNFGMFLFVSFVYNKDCSVLRDMVGNFLIVSVASCFYVQLCF